MGSVPQPWVRDTTWVTSYAYGYNGYTVCIPIIHKERFERSCKLKGLKRCVDANATLGCKNNYGFTGPKGLGTTTVELHSASWDSRA